MPRNNVIKKNGFVDWDYVSDNLELTIANLAYAAGNPVYDTFPDSDTIISMNNFTFFTTKGFYTKGDGYGCSYYVSTNWKSGSLLFGSKYVTPLAQPAGEVFLPYYGIRPGASYSASNSAILSSINYFEFGTLLRFPSGHFYFDNTISLSMGGSQLKLTGAAPVGYTLDINAVGLTWLHFPNLTEGQSAISCGASTISNVIIYGNPLTYDCYIDRSKSVIAPDQIVKETIVAKAYGIKATGNADIQNCGFMNLYYGIYCNTANTTINNVFANKCHLFVSVGNDTKVSRVFGFNVMVVLQIRGSISSATTIRGDSIGSHLVHVTVGNCIYLGDLDADYCVKSILHLGDGSWSSISTLYVNGIHGRCNIYRAYDTTKSTEPTVDSILTSDNVEEYPIISVNKQTNVYSAKIVMMGYNNNNPMDSATTYLTPTILLASDVNTNVQNIDLTLVASMASGDTTPLTPTWLSKRIKTLSPNARNLEVTVKTAFDQLMYKQSGVNITYSKLVPQNVLLVDAPVVITNNAALSSWASSITKFTSNAAVTGITLNSGTYNGQEVCIVNENSTTGYTATFASSDVSHVAGGTSVILDINSAKKFVWDASTSLWYKM